MATLYIFHLHPAIEWQIAWFYTYKAQNIKPATANFYNLLPCNTRQKLGRNPQTKSL